MTIRAYRLLVVAFYKLDQRLGVSARKQLTVTHICAALGLPPAEQKRLLEQAEAKGWTTRPGFRTGRHGDSSEAEGDSAMQTTVSSVACAHR